MSPLRRLVWGRVFSGLVLSLAAVAQGQSILYVDVDAPPGGDGSSWETAFNDLQDALAEAAGSGGTVTEIRVAEGVYRPAGPGGDRTATFQLVNGVALKGGYAGFGEPDPDERDIELHETILSGDLNGDDGPNFANNDENSYHVVTGSGTDNTAIVDGFTISGGNANGGGFSNDNGGGIYCDRGSPSVSNCSIKQNTAGDLGGGFCCYRSSNPTITNCSITGNSGLHGGGVGSWLSDAMIINCTIAGNAASGGGIYASQSNLTATKCTITDNAGTNGGGILCNGEGSPRITDCSITGNRAYVQGGGVYSGSYTNLSITNCTIMENMADGQGGGVACGMDNLTITNCVITGNTAGSQGGGIQCWVESNATIINSTITGNVAASGGGIHCSGNATPTVQGSVLWADTPQEIVTEEDCEIVVAHSDVEGGEGNVGGNGTLIWDEGNIDADPLFLDPVDGDYHLQFASPCIDVGDPDYEASEGELDLDGELRVFNDRVDMGADEYHDCNANGLPDYQDIGDGTSEDCTANHIPDECEPDCNINGVADSCDIAGGTSEDCTSNGIPDECEPDCNNNGAADTCDLVFGTSEDCSNNGIPDECIDLENDCNSNGTPDECDTADGTSEDCDGNSVPDECEDTSADCNDNGIWDPCDLAAGSDVDADQDGTIDECEEPILVYVDDDAPGDPGPGDPSVSDPGEDGSQEHPYDAIQEGINAATGIEDEDPDGAYVVEIIVVDGTYAGSGNKDLVFDGRPYLLRSENGLANCIIDCESVGRGFHFAFGETSGTRLRGFTITNGVADNGAGVYCDGSSPTITNCSITGNTAYHYYGGGVFCGNGSNPTISNCSIIGNTADVFGGGIYCKNSSPTIVECSIAGNTVPYDGGGGHFEWNSRPTIRECSIVGNSAGWNGGGLNFDDLCSPTITECTFSQNTAGHLGGGTHYIHSHPTITNCTFTQNRADTIGGGVSCHHSYSSTITDCLIAGNTAVNYYGGGVGSSGCSDLTITNCTITGNASTDGGALCSAHGYLSLQNCVLWANTSPEVFSRYYTEITVHHSDVQGGAGGVGGENVLLWGDGNIDADPLFRDPDGPDENPDTWDDNDYRLLLGSPCIDAGDNTAVTVTSDLDGNPRIVDGDGDGTDTVDMGTYEFQVGQPPIPAVSAWGVVVMVLLMTAAGTLVFRQRRKLA
jgi:predicted outer membrane repeat protein